VTNGIARPDTIRVHALIDSLGCGGAEVLLAEVAEVAGGADIALSVGYLYERPRNPVAERLRAVGVQPMPVGARRMASIGSLAAVRRQLAVAQPDVLHTHLSHADVLGGLAARSLGMPWVSTVHAAAWDGTRRERARARIAFAARRRYARRVIAVSRSARDAYLAHSRIQPGRVVVVPNGISSSREPDAGRRIRMELGLKAGDGVVVVNAPLRREKGHARALAALSLLHEHNPSLRVLLLGDGPDADEILRQAGGCNGMVSALGYRDDVMSVLDAADAVLHTPETDALPNGLIEAAAAGVPVVATATGGIPEIVDAGRTGVLVPADAGPAEISHALGRLLADAELRSRLGAEARRHFERSFSPHRWAAELRAVYEAVLEES
jgi:glycosyltransferase involved in cell wall biosynthesis